jgi:hypothetical protein
VERELRELRGLRSKYNILLKCFSQIKETMDNISNEVDEVEAEQHGNFAATSGQQIFQTPDLPLFQKELEVRGFRSV